MLMSEDNVAAGDHVEAYAIQIGLGVFWGGGGQKGEKWTWENGK